MLMSHTKSNGRFVILWLMPIYVFSIILAYILSENVYPEEVTISHFFNLYHTRTFRFNQTLFLFLVCGIGWIMFLHIVASFKKIRISFGNSLLAVLLIINIFCFVIGVNIKLLNTTKFWLFTEQISLLQVLSNLKAQGEIQLYAIMLFFTFLIPVFKIMIMGWEIFQSTAKGKRNRLLLVVSKFAMVDVFVVAIAVSTMKSQSGYIEITTKSGLTFFILSVILSLVISTCLPHTKNSNL